MQKYKVRNVAEVGMVTDLDDVDLPPNAWTQLWNVRLTDNAIKSGNGWTAAESVESVVIETPTLFEYVYCYITANDSYWILGARGDLYTFDGETLTDIGDPDILGSSSLTRWVAGNLNDVLILTNGVDEPFQWGGSGTIETLSNWQSGASCRLIVPFKNHLIAADITDTDEYPHMVWWSHPADPGAVPISWDYTDPTVDAGRTTIGDSGGRITAMMALRDSLIIHKEDSVWEMRYVGGQSIFAFRKVLSESGAVGPYAVKNILTHQVYFTDDDIVLFDGQSTKSIVQNRVKNEMFDSMNAALADRTYLMADFDNKELWVCPPDTYSESPSVGWVWSFKNDTWCFRDLPYAKHGDAGRYLEMIPGGTDQWDTEAVLEWGSETEIRWGGVYDNWLADGILVVDENYRLVWMGVGGQHSYYDQDSNETTYYDVYSYATRSGIQLSEDDDICQALELYPRIIATDTLLIETGAYMDINNSPPTTFLATSLDTDSTALPWYDPGNNQKMNIRNTGRYHYIKFTFQYDVEDPFSFTGYEINYEPVGRR